MGQLTPHLAQVGHIMPLKGKSLVQPVHPPTIVQQTHRTTLNILVQLGISVQVVLNIPISTPVQMALIRMKRAYRRSLNVQLAHLPTFVQEKGILNQLAFVVRGITVQWDPSLLTPPLNHQLMDISQNLVVMLAAPHI